MVDEKSTLPAPVPDEITTSAPVRVTAELISIKPAVVIFAAMFLVMQCLSQEDESPVVPPTAPPRVIVPDPLVRVRLSVSVPSALIVLVAKSIFPSLTVDPSTSVVIVIAPSIVTAPSKSTSPTLFVFPTVAPAVVILPFKTMMYHQGLHPQSVYLNQYRQCRQSRYHWLLELHPHN